MPAPPSQPYPFLSRLLAPRGNADLAALRRAVDGKTILLTGASFGIGRALALRLGRTRARLLLAARSLDELESVASEVRALGGDAHAFRLDLADPAAVADFAARLQTDQFYPDIAIHNAGKSIRRSLQRSLDRAHDFSRTMAVNYLGPVQLQLALLPHMLAQRAGHVVNVSTIGVRLPPAPRWAAYTAAKGAMDGWMGCAGPELRQQGIACTSVYFGLVHTRMSAPTEMYRAMPGLTPEQAALVLCRALIDRPRQIAAWWVWPVRLLMPWAEGATAWLLGKLMARLPENGRP